MGIEHTPQLLTSQSADGSAHPTAVRRLCERTRSWLDEHGARMETDPEYRAFVQYLTKGLANRPGVVGRAARGVAAAQSRVAKVL